MSEGTENISFWNHLEELRKRLIKMAAVAVIFSVVAFCLKEPLFNVILAPGSSDFITYRLLGAAPFQIELISTGLTEQFSIHVETALYVGILVSVPYLLYEIFRFIGPALYVHERRKTRETIVWGYLLFMIGTLLNYYLIFPLTVHFLGTYQVSEQVKNCITLQSYINTLLSLSLIMGIVFELPMMCWALGKMGFLSGDLMQKYQRHAFVIILIAAAIITPTTDIFTLMVVTLPLFLLYEISIRIVKRTTP